jgi:hypothetical protein
MTSLKHQPCQLFEKMVGVGRFELPPRFAAFHKKTSYFKQIQRFSK